MKNKIFYVGKFKFVPVDIKEGMKIVREIIKKNPKTMELLKH